MTLMFQHFDKQNGVAGGTHQEASISFNITALLFLHIRQDFLPFSPVLEKLVLHPPI
jgi:hypothetical protein